ncbi:MAG: hypothetical protein HQ490_01880 [Lutibacter sp.]|nr:hypothetical protein [Lutibacter sp.]
MILGIAEDFTSSIELDSQLKDVPTSGLHLNSGVHPSITVNNLLHFLPNLDLTYTAWGIGTTYGVYTDSRKVSDIVSYDSKLYQSIKSGVGQQPDTATTYWLETNEESLRLKSFVLRVKDKVYSDLRLTKRLVNNQYIYEVGEETITLPNDYSAWIFEPRGSDYTSIRINEISFQKASTTPVNLYIINQGVLIDTKQITPVNGIVSFERLDYTFKGKGKWIFAIDSTSVLTNNYTIDPLRYKGFVAYTASGIGATAQAAVYSDNVTGNGLGFNVSVFLDSSDYILNNINEFGNYIRATFEYMSLQMFLHNSNNQINSIQRITTNLDLLTSEVMNNKADTSVTRYLREKNIAIKQIQKTFDNEIGFNDYSVKIGVI